MVSLDPPRTGPAFRSPQTTRACQMGAKAVAVPDYPDSHRNLHLDGAGVAGIPPCGFHLPA